MKVTNIALPAISLTIGEHIEDGEIVSIARMPQYVYSGVNPNTGRKFALHFWVGEGADGESLDNYDTDFLVDQLRHAINTMVINAELVPQTNHIPGWNERYKTTIRQLLDIARNPAKEPRPDSAALMVDQAKDGEMVAAISLYSPGGEIEGRVYVGEKKDDGQKAKFDLPEPPECLGSPGQMLYDSLLSCIREKEGKYHVYLSIGATRFTAELTMPFPDSGRWLNEGVLERAVTGAIRKALDNANRLFGDVVASDN